MQYVRSKLFDVVFGIWTISFVVFIPFLALWRNGAAVRWFSRVWTGGASFLLRHVVGLTFRVEGSENVPREPAIFVSNHQSLWETLLFNRLVPECAIVLKGELYRFPIVGWYLRNSPMIAVRRSGMSSDERRQFLVEARTAIEAGRSIVIFPEGTRVAADIDVKFKKGVGVLYENLNVPVVPVAHNAGAFWGSISSIKHKGEITVRYLPPIPPGKSRAKFEKAVEAIIIKEKKELFESLNLNPIWISALGFK